MAVEDGAVIGHLLGRLQDAGLPVKQADKNACISGLLKLYEKIRKRRAEVNVAGAVHTRYYNHLSDGDEQQQRDRDLAKMPSTQWQGSCSFNWADAEYQRSLLGFDTLVDTEQKFDRWWQSWQSGRNGVNGHSHGIA